MSVSVLFCKILENVIVNIFQIKHLLPLQSFEVKRNGIEF